MQAESSSDGQSDICILKLELERLRSENQELRMRNHLLEQPYVPQQGAVMQLADTVRIWKTTRVDLGAGSVL